MKIIFAGTPEFAATALKALINTSHEIIAVYTQPDRKSGRGQKVTFSAVKEVAQAHNLPIYQPQHFKASTPEGIEAQNQLNDLNADLMIVAAYGLILPQRILDMPKYGCLNIHASLLPRWRGAAPIQRAIEANDPETGITIMQMAAGLDTGDMLYKTYCPITQDDTSATLHDKLSQQGADAICTTIQNENTLKEFYKNREVQNEVFTTYAHKLTKQEAQINWNQNAAEIQRKIRAFNPWPVAFITCGNNQNIRVWMAEALSQTLPAGQIGELLKLDKTGLYIQCGENSILNIISLQWPGGKPLNAVQTLQSNKLSIGQIL